MEILLEKDICETLVLEDILELSAEDKARVKEQVGIENIRSVDLVNIGLITMSRSMARVLIVCIVNWK